MALSLRDTVVLMVPTLVSGLAVAAPEVRDTGAFYDATPRAMSMAGDRFLGALVETEAGQRVQILDTLTWQLITSEDGATGLEPCVTGSTSTTANNIVAYEAGSETGFMVVCEGGLVSQVVVGEQTTIDSTFEIESAQLTSIEDGASFDVTTDLVDVAIADPGTASYLYILGDDGSTYLFTLDSSTFGTSNGFVNGEAIYDGSGVATHLAVGFTTFTGASDDPVVTLAVSFSDDGLRVFNQEAGTIQDSGCAVGVTDLAFVGTTLFVSNDGSGELGPLVYSSMVGAHGACTSANVVVDSTLSSIESLAFSESGSTGQLLVSGARADGSGDSVLSLDVPATLTDIAVTQTYTLPENAGTLAAAIEIADVAFNLSVSSTDLMSDKPFIDLTTIGIETQSETTSSDTSEDDEDDDSTPVPSITTTTTILSLSFTSDEAGELTIQLDDADIDPDDVGRNSVSAGEVVPLNIDLGELDEDDYTIIILVTDEDGNIGQVTRFLTLNTPPLEPGNATVGFGNNKVIIEWDEPNETDIDHYDFVIALGSEDEAAPFENGGDFISGGLKSESFVVNGTDGEVIYPDDIDDDGDWPVQYTLETGIETFRDDLSRKYILEIAPLTNGQLYYVSFRAVDAEEFEGPWTGAVAVTPERVCGAACLSGDTGGYCAIVPTDGPGRFGGGLVAFMLMSYLGIRLRRSEPGFIEP